MADPAETSITRPLRPAAPALAGPLASSGAAPDPAFAPDPVAVPHPRTTSEGDPTASPGDSTTPADDTTAADDTTTTDDATATDDATSADSTTTTDGTAQAAPTNTAAADDGTPVDDVTSAGGTAEAGATDDPAPAGDTLTGDTAAGDTAAGDTAAGAAPGETVVDLDVPPTRRNRRIRTRFAHAARRWPSPRKAAIRGVRAVRAWSRRPSGQLTLPALLLFALVAGTGTAGAVLVPAAGRTPEADVAASLAAPSPEAALPTATPGGLPVSPSPSGTSPPTSPGTGDGAPHVLAGWAAQIGGRLGIPQVAMQAYGYAELRLGETNPGCQLRWTTLAAIGFVESAHGTVNGSRLTATGVAEPEIYGPVLDGTDGRKRIMDTDDGRLDGDATYDRAVGPMQFIPSTWEADGVDADLDGQRNPQDIDDAALAAGNYLCKNGRNLSVGTDWWNAILSYNNLQSYAQSVFDKANEYGLASRT